MLVPFLSRADCWIFSARQSPNSPKRKKRSVHILYGRLSMLVSIVCESQENVCAELEGNCMTTWEVKRCVFVCVCMTSPVDWLPRWLPIHSSLFMPHPELHTRERHTQSHTACLKTHTLHRVCAHNHKHTFRCNCHPAIIQQQCFYSHNYLCHI